MPHSSQKQITETETSNSNWKSLYIVAGVTALLIFLNGLVDIGIMFFPGGAETPGTRTVTDWFLLFQSNRFLALRDLGLLNIINSILMVPIYLTFYHTHRRTNQAFAALAAILSFVGIAIYIDKTTVLSMFDLSSQFATATTEAQKSMLVAAGNAILALGEDLRPGTFMGFFLTEVAGLVMSIVLLRGKVFNMLTGWLGILGFGLLLFFNICAAFVPALSDVVAFLGAAGGLLMIAWDALVARKFFQLGKSITQ